MDFDLSNDQTLLGESVEKLFAAAYGDFEKRKAYAKHPNGFDPAIWAEYADAGLLALPLPEEQGGFGGGPLETMIVMEQAGKALALEPYLTSTILCGDIIQNAGKTEILVDGTSIFALAYTERGSRYDLHDVSLAARADGGDYLLEGEKSVVVGGGAADQLIVSARTAGNRRDAAGITLFLVDPKTPGISRRAYPTQDATQAAEISFAQARIPESAALGPIGEGLPLLTRGVDLAIAGLCAEAVGAMDALVKLTVDYMKTRKQFGVPIGSFQALQHRATDMFVALEQARSMAIYAALAASDPKARHEAVAAAKVQIGRSAKFIGQQATQLHGGIGMTNEYKSGHYFKRLTMIDQAFGDADFHLRALAAAGAAIAA